MIAAYAVPLRDEPAPVPLGEVQVLTPKGPTWVACYGAHEWLANRRSASWWWLDFPAGGGVRRWDVVWHNGRAVRIGTGTFAIDSPGCSATFLILPFRLRGEAVGDLPLFSLPLYNGDLWPVHGYGPGYVVDGEGATWLVSRATRYRWTLVRA